MSNMGKYSSLLDSVPQNTRGEWSSDTQTNFMCPSAFLIIVRMEAHYFLTTFISEGYHNGTKIKRWNDWNKRRSEFETNLPS